MVPDLTLEVIYFNEPTDFKMEFDLCGNCNLRFLSFIAKEKKDFLTALSKGVARSRAIIAVGSFSPLEDTYLPKIIAKAVGYALKPVDRDELSVVGALEYGLPETAIPLVTENGVLGGCVLENNDQTIILLTADKKIRHKLIKDLVCPYLQIFAGRGIGHTTEKKPPQAKAEKQQEVEQEDEQPVKADTAKIGDKPFDETALPFVPDLDINNLTADAIMAMVDSDIKTADAAGHTQANDQADDVSGEQSEESSAEAALPVSDENTHNLAVEVDTDTEADAQSAIAVAEKAEEETVEENPDGAMESSALESVYADEDNALAENEDELFDLGSVINLPKGNEDKISYTVLAEPESEAEARRSLQEFLADEYDEEIKTSKKRKRKRAFKVLISFILIIAVLLSAFFGYSFLYQPIQNASVYASVRELYGQTWEGLPSDMLYKFGKLYQTNKDIYGWISIPGTNVNYPVVTSANKGAAYYENHSFEGSVNRFGTPYTSGKVSEYGYTANTVIYGSNSNEGVMFSELSKYTDIEHYRSAPVFSFDSIYTENRWKIFAVIQLSDQNEAKFVRSSFFDDTEFLNYIDFIKKSSLITTNIDVDSDDKLITLVSKGGESRVALIARKVREGESPLVDSDSKLNVPVTEGEKEEISEPSYLEEITVEETEDTAMADGNTGRYEQPKPEQSEEITVKPTPPREESSSKPSSTVSAKPSSRPSSSYSSRPPSSSGVLSSSSAVSSDDPDITAKLPVLTVTNNFDGKKYSGPANEIVARILEAEMGSHYHIEALKAQAVAAYSWLLCNGAATGKAPSAPLKNPGERAKDAADAVAGEVVVYGGKVVSTYYYAISAGKTANPEDIWGGSYPYVVSVDSSVDKNASGFETIRKYSAEDVKKWVKEQLGVDLSTISDKKQWFKCTYDKNGLYVKTVTIGSKTVKGPYLRNSLFTAARVGSKNVLRSSAYTIDYSGAEDKFIFTVRGYGHGVGMSQVGANAYAKSGMDYKAILTHYYTGITLGTYYDN